MEYLHIIGVLLGPGCVNGATSVQNHTHNILAHRMILNVSPSEKNKPGNYFQTKLLCKISSKFRYHNTIEL